MALLLAACEKARQWSQVEVTRLRGRLEWELSRRETSARRLGLLAWYLRDERSGSRAEGKNSHVLSRDSGALARDGGDARGGIVFALVSRSICGWRLLRFVDDRSGSRAGGVGWIALVALFDGRADAA